MKNEIKEMIPENVKLILDDINSNILWNYITNLQEENKKLNNIIDELEYCIENSYAEYGYEILYIMRKDGKDETLYSLEDVKNRIKALKEGK